MPANNKLPLQRFAVWLNRQWRGTHGTLTRRASHAVYPSETSFSSPRTRRRFLKSVVAVSLVLEHRGEEFARARLPSSRR